MLLDSCINTPPVLISHLLVKGIHLEVKLTLEGNAVLSANS